MKACAIVSGGSFSPLDGIGRADFVIACDKGCEYTAACGIKPDLLVGDFDSYTGEKPEDVPVLGLPCEKDDTDDEDDNCAHTFHSLKNVLCPFTPWISPRKQTAY